MPWQPDKLTYELSCSCGKTRNPLKLKFRRERTYGTPCRQKILFNPRPGGGGGFFSPLQTFRYISRTAAPIVTKLSVPSRVSILHIVTKHFSKGYDRLPGNDVRVTSCSAVFGPLPGFAARAVRPTALKIQKKRSRHKRCKMIGATKLMYRNFDFFFNFDPPIFF